MPEELPWDKFIAEEFESEDHNLADYSPRELLKMFYNWLEDHGELAGQTL